MLLRRVSVLVFALLAFASPADAAPLSNVGTTRICSGCAERAGDLSRYAYVTLHAWEFRRIPALKAANPHLKVLVYKDMASTPAYDCHNGRDDEFLPAGIGYCWALANHPDWFTLDESGKRIEWQVWGGNWQMDVGSHAYQDQWAENVRLELRRYGWDGVTIDDANVDQSRLVGVRMREYPTQASYEAATRSFLQRVGPRLMQAGFLVIPNIQADPVHADARLWADWIQFTSGGTREYWMKWGSGREGQYGAGGWNDLQDVFQTVQRAGKIFLTTTTAPAGDVRSMRWGRASFLVGWNGGPSAFMFDPGVAADPWSAEWTVDVGRPVGARFRVGDVWRRNFTGGTALVNTSEKASQTVDLGASYFTPEGLPVREVTLRPLTGLVLRNGPGVAPARQPNAKPKPSAKLQGGQARGFHAAVSLSAGPVIHGRVHGARGSWRVTVWWKGRAGWRILARVYSSRRGAFRVRKQPHPARAIQLRAVAERSRIRIRSPLVVRRRLA